jgi:hypothetical protein
MSRMGYLNRLLRIGIAASLLTPSPLNQLDGTWVIRREGSSYFHFNGFARLL